MFPQHVFVGTDIYDEVVEYSSDYHNYPNLSFVKCSAKEIGNIFNIMEIDVKIQPIKIILPPILILASGSLQYVQPEHLIIFFNSLSNFANLKILLLEPGNESKGKPDEIKTSIWRGNFSYTHDYKHYAEMAGLKTIENQIIKPYSPDDSVHSSTCHYYYLGETKPS